MSSARDPHSILNRRPELGGFQVPPPKAKITRYFPGKAPDWQKDNDSDDDIFPSEPDLKSLGGTSITSDKLNKRLTFLEEDTRKDKKIEERVVVRSEKVVERKSNAQNIHKEKKDKLEKDQTNEKIESNEKNITKDLKLNQSGVEIVGEIDVVDRRAALKARLLAKEQETVKAVQAEKNEKNAILERNTIEKIEIEEEEDDNEEEIVEEYEENEGGLFNILKPIYVKKDERSGINDKQVLEELALDEEKKKLMERKKIEAKILVSEAVKRVNDEDEDAEKSNSEQGLPDDNDDFEQEQELELWKIRELKRIKREREERSKREKELAEIVRRRNLTDEQRLAENLKLGSDETEKPEKSHYRFLQKYYHKGAFYQDSEDPLLKRDYNIAVGEDMFDKSGLPSVLKKRRGNFGKKGQSKYTHLTDQDTTDFNPEVKPDDSLREKMYARMAGLKGNNIMERKDLKKLKL